MGTRNKLTKDQKGAILKWVAEGLETDEINKRAAEFDPPFRVSRVQVDYYRKTRGVNIKAIALSGEYNAFTEGLARKGERVKRLALLAAMLEDDIFGGVTWTQDVKIIGTGDYQERVEFETFNASEIQQYRGTLDDIAKEMGDRGQNTRNLNIDLSTMTDEQLKRIANGEDILHVLATTSPGRNRAAEA
jgi:hypothetical protein